MASEEDSFANSASKKRVASRQISKDDDPEVEEETPLDGDTFRKAPDAVLAGRRIVKVRRTGGSVGAAPAAVNPFASIRLVPPAALPTPVAEPIPAEAIPAKAEIEPTPAEPSPAQGEIQSTPSESLPEVSSEDPAESKEFIVSVVSEDLPQGVLEPTTEPVSVVTITETKIDTVPADDSTKVVEKVVDVQTDTKAVTNGSPTGVVGATVPSSETFQQASSAKNAFSASFGTGFPATSTAFGSNQSTLGGFGSLNGGFSFGSGSAFGSSPAFGSSSAFGSSLFGSAGGFGQPTNTGLNPVFEKTNGTSTFQLPGSTTSASPANAASSATKITLQEVPLETGEEKEKAVFSADASLFEFLDGGWKERGKGEIKVSVPEDVQRKSRLVMRSKGNLRLLLNANIFPDMKITKMDNRGVTFVCANASAGGKEGLTTYALKLRDPQIAKDFMSTVEAHKGTAADAE